MNYPPCQMFFMFVFPFMLIFRVIAQPSITLCAPALLLILILPVASPTDAEHHRRT